MGAITMEGILRAEHDMIKAAYEEWALECPAERMSEVVYYLNGVNDFAQRLIDTLGGANGDHNN